MNKDLFFILYWSFSSLLSKNPQIYIHKVSYFYFHGIILVLLLCSALCHIHVAHERCTVDAGTLPQQRARCLVAIQRRFLYRQVCLTRPFCLFQLASWDLVAEDECCLWDGVECDDYSGYVIGLDIASSYLYGSINSSSTLFELARLQRLDLSDNNFSFSQIPSRLGHALTSLTYLNLSMSSFSGLIPYELSYLTNLTTLHLSSNLAPDFKVPPLKMPYFTNLVRNLTRIKKLHLFDIDISSKVPDELMNVTSLTSLIIHACKLEGELPLGIFKMPNLEVLDLSDNYDLTGHFPRDLNASSPLKILSLQATNFSGRIPASLGNLHGLNLLNIRSCNFYPYVPSSLSNLTQLTFLELSSFYDYSYLPDLPTIHTFSDQVSDSWSWFGKLTKLNHLSLDTTHLIGDLPCPLANLTQLLVLDLTQNDLTGEIPCCLASLSRLLTLRLGHNQLTGHIPSCLMELSHLTMLDLRFNNLQGEIPMSLFELTSLEYVYLHSNRFNGSVALDEFSKLPKLRGLRLSLNKFSVMIKLGFDDIASKLEVLGLGSCNLTEFPDFLRHASQLEDLDLSDNNLHGKIPKWLWTSTGDTFRFLNLSYNYLTGFEDDPIMIPWLGLYSIELDSNMFQGSLLIPSPLISYYSVTNNEYAGEIPAAFCDTWALCILDLSNNNLNGSIPQCFENFRFLQLLKPQNNSFDGDIPQIGLKRCLWLRAIDLSYNQLQGKVPRSIANCSKMMYLNLGNNQISDGFPSWLGMLQQLKVVILKYNAFHGVIGNPKSGNEFPQLSIIDLSSNGFSGTLPSSYIENWNAMKSVDTNEQLYFQSMFFFGGTHQETFYYDYPITVSIKGVRLKYVKTPYPMRLIDMSSNKFKGDIPSSIGNLRGLTLLNLSNNTLNGVIPSSIGNVTALESLDLSENRLSGKIPGDLAQLTFLAYFNVSYNVLYGPIPQGQQFDTFQEDMYQGNSGLCGEPVSMKCDDIESVMPRTSTEKDEEFGFEVELDWFMVLPGVVVGLIVRVIGGNLWMAKRNELFVDKLSIRWGRRQVEHTRHRREIRPWSF